MIKTHIDALENVLIAQSKIANNAGHPNLRGGPREWFVREFLENNLPSTLEVGQGEIIDANSIPNPPQKSYRPQIDVVIYRRDMPKLYYSPENAAYLIEGAMAAIEVKTKLTKTRLRKYCVATKYMKDLSRETTIHGFVGYLFYLDNIVSYLVAYDGPSDTKKVAEWLESINKEIDAHYRQTIDMIVILGRGVVCRKKAVPDDFVRSFPATHNWLFTNQKKGNLHILFTHMLTWVSNSMTAVNVSGYLQNEIFKGWNSL